MRLKKSRRCLIKDSFVKLKEFSRLLENLDESVISGGKIKNSFDTIIDIKEKEVNLEDSQIKKMQISIFDSVKQI